MTDTNAIPADQITPISLLPTEEHSPESQSFSEPSNTLFQPVKEMGNLTQETIQSGTELLGDISQIGSNVIQTAGAIMTEPSNLFQPTKAVSTLGSFAKNIGSAGIEGAKDLATDSITLATDTIWDISNIGKDVANIWMEPKPVGEWLFQPKKPLNDLSSLWSKVIKSWVAIVGGTASTGVNVAKNVVKAWTNLLKKGLWIFWKKDEGEEK